MKQTAVEWLLDNLISEPHSEHDFEHNVECWNKAELINYQQLRDAFINGEVSRDRFDFQQYYKETYNK